MKKKIFRIAIVMLLCTAMVSSAVGINNKEINSENNFKSINRIINSYENIDWWPQFAHDPQNSGNTTSEGRYNDEIKWSFQLSGDPGSPIIYNNSVYVSKVNLYCLNPLNGSIKWEYPKGGYVAVANDYVYLTSGSNVYCINAINGSYIWQSSSIGSQAQSPTVFENKIFVLSSTGCYCLNIENGSEIWHNTGIGQYRNSPAVAYGNVYMMSKTGNIYCLNDTNGNIIWSHQIPTFESYGSPVIYDEMLYVGGFDLHCLDVYGNGDGTTTEIWRFQGNNAEEDFYYMTPSTANNNVYFGSVDWVGGVSPIYCVDAYGNGDGTTTKIWNYTIDSHYQCQGSGIAITKEMLYILTSPYPDVTDGDELVCLDITSDTPTKIWGYDTEQIQEFTSPAVADGSIYISSINNRIYCFGDDPPETPDKPNGATVGEIDQSYTYTTNICIDPNGDDVKYRFDWGDGNLSNWRSNPEAHYSWDKIGTYKVKIIAKDVRSDPEYSDWSETLVVKIVKSIINIGNLYSSYGGLGKCGKINLEIGNLASVPVKNVNWDIKVCGGFLKLINAMTNSIIESFEAGNNTIISTDKPIFGFGDINITITIQGDNFKSLTIRATGIVIGPFILEIKQN